MQLSVNERTVEVDLIVFDKDGTLVDLHATWGYWAERVAAELAIHLPADRLLARLGWDAAQRKIAPETPLAIASATTMQAVIATWLYEKGMYWSAAMIIAQDALDTPEVFPAPPLCPLAPLFESLAAQDVKLAVVTTDDHIGVERDLGPHGVLPYLSAIISADSKLPTKPAPDMFLAACAQAGVAPTRTAMVGDTIDDLWMARDADAALLIGVLTGAGTAETLAREADLLLPSVVDVLDMIV